MPSGQSEQNVFSDLKSVVDNLLLLLSDKERFVVVNRFDLEASGRLTLDLIGRRFSVTRERVRQIEKNALTKLRRNVFNTRLVDLQERIRSVLEVHGGVMKESALFAYLIAEDDLASFNKSTTRLAAVLSENMRLSGNTIDFHPYVAFEYVGHAALQKIASKSIAFLRKRNNVVMINEIYNELKSEFENYGWYSIDFLRSFFKVHKKIKVLQDAIGLIQWRHIHPRTLRDKIFFVLRNVQKPLHFVDVSNKIMESDFDSKSVNVQAVHNELIRYEEFVLIGRGIYALKEWGYKHGTTKDVIIDLLKAKSVMSEDEILKKVLDKRQVKPITVLLALKNCDEFVRVGRKKYQLKK